MSKLQNPEQFSNDEHRRQVDQLIDGLVSRATGVLYPTNKNLDHILAVYAHIRRLIEHGPSSYQEDLLGPLEKMNPSTAFEEIVVRIVTHQTGRMLPGDHREQLHHALKVFESAESPVQNLLFITSLRIKQKIEALSGEALF